MTVLLPEPGRLLTVAEFEALGEDDRYRWELQEGVLCLSPSPKPRHSRIGSRLFGQLDPQLPPELVVVQDVDLDLQLVPGDQPGTVRRPDLFVVDTAEYERVDNGEGVLRAAHTHLVVEIVSPGSRRTDHVTKRSEYADAGIPTYWIIDPDMPVSLLTLRLTDMLGYVDEGEVTGTFRTSAPCRLTIDLDRLAEVGRR